MEELEEGARRQPRPVGAVHRARRSSGRRTFDWVKGHSGDPMNDLVDRLAVAASHVGPGRVGRRAADRGRARPADRPARSHAGVGATAAARGARRPHPAGLALRRGRGALRATRRRPSGCARCAATWPQVLAAQAELRGDLVVLTGLRAGNRADRGAAAAVDAGRALRGGAAVPGPDRGMARDRTRELRPGVRGGRGVVTLETATTGATPRAAGRRWRVATAGCARCRSARSWSPTGSRARPSCCCASSRARSATRSGRSSSTPCAERAWRVGSRPGQRAADRRVRGGSRRRPR